MKMFVTVLLVALSSSVNVYGQDSATIWQRFTTGLEFPVFSGSFALMGDNNNDSSLGTDIASFMHDRL